MGGAAQPGGAASEGAARSESLADCRQVALQGVQRVFPYLQGVLTTPAGLPSL